MKELVRFEDAGIVVESSEGRMVRIDGCGRPSTAPLPPRWLMEDEVQELVTVLVNWLNGDDR